MATPVFAPGYVAKANVTMVGGSATDINIVESDWVEEVLTLITTHTGSGGIQERIAAVFDARGSIHFNYDVANQHHKTTWLIIPGAKGLIKLFVTATLFYAIPIIVKDIPWKSAVAGKVEIIVNFELSGDAGSLTRPV